MEDQVNTEVKVNMKEESHRKLTQKWGKETAKAGYLQVPYLLLEKQHALGINNTQMVILLNILKHWWEADKKPFPTVGKLAMVMGLKRNTIQKALSGLVELKLLKRKYRYSTDSKGQISNEYSFDGLIEALVPHAKEFLEQKQQHQDEKQVRARRKKAKIADVSTGIH